MTSRRELVLLLAILLAGGVLRVWPPWGQVFREGRVDFLETDAWYHVRRIEHQVRHFPHQLTDDPYVADGGLYVPLAPLFDTIGATVVWLTAGRNAPTLVVERVAAWLPPILGLAATVAVWVAARRMFGPVAALLAALFAAVLPGHFLDRTLLGFVDHHALESLLAVALLAALSWTTQTPWSWARAPASGAILGLYLLSWGSGALLVAILTAWIGIVPMAVRDRACVRRTAALCIVTSIVAWMVIAVGQDSRLYRYDLQIASLAIWSVVSLAAWLSASDRLTVPRGVVALGFALTGVAVAAAFTMLAPDLAGRVVGDLLRFRPDPARMAVLEARPLFLYSGRWDWAQPWTFFGSAFSLGLGALAALAVAAWKSGRVDHLLLVVSAAAMYAATLGQNRFGYYLVPMVSLTLGWLCAALMARAASRRRPLVLAIVIALAVAPNLPASTATTARASAMTDAWHDTMTWLRRDTPEPFDAGPGYYDESYAPGSLARPGYTVMNWWDQGYWLVQIARRVPVANPTQSGAREAARFYTATDEQEAVGLMADRRARFAIVDWELPFRDTGGGLLSGRFESLAHWAGRPTGDFYRLCYESAGGGWMPVWMFLPAYYQTMAYRLMVLGGQASLPAAAPWRLAVRDRVDADGRTFCEVTRRVIATDGQRDPDTILAGLDPWRSPFRIERLQEFAQVYEARGARQPEDEAPMVRVFEMASR